MLFTPSQHFADVSLLHHQYLDDIACPRRNDADAASRHQLVDWLLTFAVTLEYSEDGVSMCWALFVVNYMQSFHS